MSAKHLERIRSEPALTRPLAVIAASVALIVTHTAFPAAAREAAVVVIQQTPAEPVPERAVRTVERVIEQSTESTALDAGELSRRVRSKVRNPPALERQVVGVLEREAGELLESVAFGQDEETIARGRAALRRESVRLSATNRSEAASDALANICLFVVRALLHRSEERAAHAQARECLRMIPDLEPSVETHPPAVRTVVARLRSEKLARLAVVPAVAVSRACSVYIQGRRAGVLPLEIELVPGVYSLQAECGAPGLVHDVVLRGGPPARVTIAPRLERALRLERPTVLHSGGTPAELQAEDLLRFVDWIAVPELWTLERRASMLRITRWQHRRGNLVATSVIGEPLEPASTLDERIEAACRRALCGAGGCAEAEQGPRGATRSAAIALGGVGISAMLGSWIAWNEYRDIDTHLDRLDLEDPRYREALDDRNAFRDVALVSTATGSALFTAAAPFWLPNERGVPWWAWSTGALGASAVGVGTTVWLSQDLEPRECPPGATDCTRKRSAVPLAPMLITQGASLLSIPLTFLIRRWSRADTGRLELDVSPTGFSITARR